MSSSQWRGAMRAAPRLRNAELPGSSRSRQLKFERVITPAVWPLHAVSPAQELQRLAGEIVMPHYLFHLSDEENTYFDDTGKQLEDSRAAHAHALRIIEKVRRFIPDADKSTWRIRITLPTGQSVMTVISRAVGDGPQKPFGKRSGPCLAPSMDEEPKGQPA
jgi:hypothetical protein